MIEFNEELLLEVKAKIQQNPENFDMRDIVRDTNLHIPGILDKEYPDCNTVGCIAGWAIACKRGKAYGDDVNAIFYARNLLGLYQHEADRLFHLNRWDNYYKLKYEASGTSEDRVKATCEYINYFISEVKKDRALRNHYEKGIKITG